MDPNNPADMAAHVEFAPFSAMAAVVSGWLLGVFIGSLVICLIDKQRPMVSVSILAAFAEAGVIFNAMFLPHPLWMTATGIVLIPLVAYISPGVIFSRRHSRQ
jgi:dipeptide/tripeptide permease